MIIKRFQVESLSQRQRQTTEVETDRDRSESLPSESYWRMYDHPSNDGAVQLDRYSPSPLGAVGFPKLSSSRLPCEQLDSRSKTCREQSEEQIR